MVPAIFAVVLLVMFGIVIFSGNRTATPSRTTSTDTRTQTPIKTTPTQPQ